MREKEIRKAVLLKVSAVLALVLVPTLSFAPVVMASGDAAFSFSTSGGTVVGNTFSLTVSETSTSGDNVNAVQANVAYPTAQLQYQSMSLGAFTLCGQQTAGAGEIQVGCASTSAVSGTQTVVTITFSIVGSGSAQVHLLSGSDIDNTSGLSVWNGTLTSNTYSFTAPYSGGGTTSSGSGSSSAGPKPSGTTSTSTSKPATGSTSGASGGGSTASTPTPTIKTTPSTVTAPVSALSIMVTDSSGKPVQGAKVTVDGRHTAYTNAQGAVAFSGLSSGSHAVVVSADGEETLQQQLSLSTNESKTISLKLASKKTSTAALSYVVIGVVVLGGTGVGFMVFRGRTLSGSKPVTQGIVVGGATPQTPAPVSITPQVISPSQQPINPGSNGPARPIDPSFKP